MNLKEIYEIFYPKRTQNNFSVWKELPKYRSKKEFFETIIPMELRWLNIKLWNDKARRSRFFADSGAENGYLFLLKEFIQKNPLVISRIESKGQDILKEQLSSEKMNQIFSKIVYKEQIQFSPTLQRHLMDEEGTNLTMEWGNVLAFMILYSMFPESVHQLYAPYLYKKENIISNIVELEQDKSLFQYEYPPDMSVHNPGDCLNHTWVIKNVGEITWEQRYLECVSAPDWLSEESKIVPLPEKVYPGDTISLSVHLKVPKKTGTYVLNWKMKDKDGNSLFLDKVGLGLHFTVLEKVEESFENKKNNYQIVEENPIIPAVIRSGKVHEHKWVIENTGTVSWENYYCECINGEALGYTKKELRIYLKQKVKPGEKVTIQVELIAPPVEGVCCLIWKLMGENGKTAFSAGRQLEVLLYIV